MQLYGRKCRTYGERDRSPAAEHVHGIPPDVCADANRTFALVVLYVNCWATIGRCGGVAAAHVCIMPTAPLKHEVERDPPGDG